VIPQCKHLFTTMGSMQVFLNDYLPVKSLKIKAARSEDYFVRLKDDLALISYDLLMAVVRAMNELRRLNDVYYELRADQGVSTSAGSNTIWVKQFDITQDVAGLVFTGEIKKWRNLLASVLNLTTASKHKSMSSCLQMVEVRQGVTNKQAVDAFTHRVKIYNKFPQHLLQSSSLLKKVSMGLSSIYRCESSFYQRM
jgi:hypothetical protein